MQRVPLAVMFKLLLQSGGGIDGLLQSRQASMRGAIRRQGVMGWVRDGTTDMSGEGEVGSGCSFTRQISPLFLKNLPSPFLSSDIRCQHGWQMSEESHCRSTEGSEQLLVGLQVVFLPPCNQSMQHIPFWSSCVLECGRAKNCALNAYICNVGI